MTGMMNGLCGQCGGWCCSSDFALGVEVTATEYMRLNGLIPGCVRNIGPGRNVLDFDRNKGSCPFLNMEKKCSIYDQRPEGCREYLCSTLYEVLCEETEEETRQSSVLGQSGE